MSRIIEFFRMEAVDGFSLFWIKEIMVAALIFLAFWVGSRILRSILVTWGPRFTAFTKSDLDDRILARITPPVCLLVVFAGVYFAVKSLPFPELLHRGVSGLVFVINIIIMTNIAYRTTDELLQWYASRFAEHDRGGLDRQLIPLVEKLVSIFLVGTALIVTLKHFDYDILSLVTALGIGSLAIGLAAKDTLANMISGFTLMIDRPFRIGDRIQLMNGQWGDVLDIGLRSTKIRALDNTLQIIPNSTLCNSVVTNMAFPDLRVKGRIDLGVAYGSDIALVKEILMGIVTADPEVMDEPVSEACLLSFGASALNMALFFWVADYTRLASVTDRINSVILHRFQEAGIVIPFPTTTVLLEKDHTWLAESK